MSFRTHLANYINDTVYKITIFNNKINIVNYTEIFSFSTTKIIIKHKSGKTIIHGNNLAVSKMIEDEILITG
ncbi:MAG: YabP/YqfC family sporulation protein, partial [bacterium]|nr:YabP/YqfC family sporulation protein [bacterium]